MKKRRSLQVPLLTFPMLALWLGALGGCASAPHPAEPWWKRGDLVEALEAATGLTGGALVAYLVVSEGLRIVLPVRNFVYVLP